MTTRDYTETMQQKESEKHQLPFACVNCGKAVPSVYIEYSPGNIRLSNCIHCEGIVDKYVEYEFMIVVIDIILYKYEAYRHVFFNYPRLNKINVEELVWKTTLCFLVLDTWRWISPGDGHMRTIDWDSPGRFLVTAGKLLAQVGVLDCIYVLVIVLTLNVVSSKGCYRKAKYREVYLAILFSSHFRYIIFATMVWEFSYMMGLMVDVLILTSNLVALEVMLGITRFQAASAVASGAICKLLLTMSMRSS